MIHRYLYAARGGFTGVVFLLAVFCLLPYVKGQSATATLSGTIEDTNGAVIPGVAVTVTNTGTAMQRKTVTSEQGHFTVPLLPPGTYTVRAERDGFAPVEARDGVLNVGDQKALQIQLKAGDVNAQVTVDSNAETTRTDGSVGTVVDRQFVANIPLNGRSLQALIQLTPGVVLTGNNGNATSGAQFSVNGQRSTANYWMVDGLSANTGINVGSTVFPGAAGSGQTAGTTVLGGTNNLVSLDALQEFRIETSTFAAQFGSTPGGQISLLTRSGTNQFHGSAAYYFRNETLDANDWFANANRQPKPRERQNFFAGVFGGPIKRDRLFFFVSYEGLRLQQPQVKQVTVPTVALRAQSVSALRPYLNALPLPNGRDLGNGTGEFTGSYSDPGSFNVFALRMDGRLTNSLMGFFRFSRAPSKTKIRAFALSTLTTVKAANNAYTGGVTWVPGSRISADLRINWTRNAPRLFNDLDTFGGAVIPKVSDVFVPGREPSQAVSTFTAINSSFAWGPGTSDVQRQFNGVGTLAWVIGNHQLKFGVDYRRLLPLFGATGGTLEQLFFSTAQQVSAGQALFYLLSQNDTVPREAIISNLSLFVQDTWLTTRRLTLTYGLRFERVPPPGEATGRLPRSLLGIESDPLQNPRLAPEGTPLFHSRFGSFAPRLGVAYQLYTRRGWETTLRGGVGIFYDLGLGSIANAFQFIYPFFITKQSNSVTLPLNNAVRTPPTVGVDRPRQFYLLDPNLRLPYTVQGNVTWEQALGSSQSVAISYVGSAGRRLLVQETYSRPLAEWPTLNTTINVQRNLGQSAYHALQIQYQHRLSRGLQALASYTFGRSQDNASTQDVLAPASRADLLAREYGPSDFDVRQLMSAAVTYELPKPSGPVAARALLKDWSVDLLIRYQSAMPVNLSAGIVFLPDGSLYIPRPDLVSGQPLYISDSSVPGGRRFNRAAFTTPAPGSQGNFPRNGLRGFSASQVDFALRREFRFSERLRLQLRGELFNLFNHPNFAPPSTSLTSSLFGQPTQMLNRSLGGLNALYQMGGPRSGELAVKLIW